MGSTSVKSERPEKIDSAGKWKVPPHFQIVCWHINSKKSFKIFFKVGTKIAKIMWENFFFDPPKSFAIWDLWRILIFKIDLHSPGTPTSSKNKFCGSINAFLEGFGVLGGCKLILNVKCLRKSHIAELFGPRVFCFSVGQIFKKILKKKKRGCN